MAAPRGSPRWVRCGGCWSGKFCACAAPSRGRRLKSRRVYPAETLRRWEGRAGRRREGQGQGRFQGGRTGYCCCIRGRRRSEARGSGASLLGAGRPAGSAARAAQAAEPVGVTSRECELFLRPLKQKMEIRLMENKQLKKVSSSNITPSSNFWWSIGIVKEISLSQTTCLSSHLLMK